MPLDTSDLSPADAQQVQMFETLLDSLPDDALALLSNILKSKLDERRGH